MELIIVLLSFAIFFLLIFILQMLYRFWEVLTVNFVKGELNYADSRGARELLRTMDYGEILKLNPSETQALLQLAYVFNRIGSGIRRGYLNERAIFETWRPAWFFQNWRILRPLIESERERRKNPDLYKNFQWLAEERCPKIAVHKIN